jgi:transcriptional regulator with XRE-family HTH domain
MNDLSVNNWKEMSDKSLLEALGRFIQHHRLNQNKSQEETAKAAGISRSTLSLLERGEKVRIDSFLQVLRILDLLHVLEVFNIKEEISPLAYAKLKKKQRKQASPKKGTNAPKSDLQW